MVVNIDGAQETTRDRIEIHDLSLPDRVNRLTSSGIEVLICGAISEPLYDMLELAGIEVTPFLSGDAEGLLNAFIEERISDPRFLMPGCRGIKRRRRRCKNRRGERKDIQ